MKKILLPALAVAGVLFTACSSAAPAAPSVPPASAPSASAPVTSASASTTGTTCAYTATSDAAKKVTLPPTTNVPNTGTVAYTLKLNDTALGLTLDRQKAPCTVNSFTSLAAQGYFDGTSCHRLVDASGLYVLQCGDPTGTGSGGPGYQFPDELSGKETYTAGTLAMANAGAGTNGSQFFIVFADSQLPASYTVFGHVDEAGVKAVAALAKGGQDGSYGDGSGKPRSPAVITSVTPG